MPITRMTVDEGQGQVQYSIEHSFKDKQDFVNFITRFQAKANSLGLAIQIVELPPAPPKMVDKL